MKNRRDFLKTSAIGAGALALNSGVNLFGAQSAKKGMPKRFVFIRKSNGIMPDLYSLPTFSDSDKAKDKNKTAGTFQ